MTVREGFCKQPFRISHSSPSPFTPCCQLWRAALHSKSKIGILSKWVEPPPPQKKNQQKALMFILYFRLFKACDRADIICNSANFRWPGSMNCICNKGRQVDCYAGTIPHNRADPGCCVIGCSRLCKLWSWLKAIRGLCDFSCIIRYISYHSSILAMTHIMVKSYNGGSIIYRVFFYWSALKTTKCHITCIPKVLALSHF